MSTDVNWLHVHMEEVGALQKVNDRKAHTDKVVTVIAGQSVGRN